MPKSKSGKLKAETESRIMTERSEPDVLKKEAILTKILDYYPLSEKPSTTASNGEPSMLKAVDKSASGDIAVSLKSVERVKKRQSRASRQRLRDPQGVSELKQEATDEIATEVHVRDQTLGRDPTAAVKEDVSLSGPSALSATKAAIQREDASHSVGDEPSTVTVAHADLPWTTVQGKKKKGGKPRTSASKSVIPPRQSVNRLVTDYFPIRRSDRSIAKEQKIVAEEALHRKIESACEDGLKVVTITGKGRGVLAENSIKRGDFVVEYAGDLIDLQEARKREVEYAAADRGCYMYYFNHRNKHYCVDATQESGRLGRLLNHSKQGNCMTKLIEVRGLPRLIIVAARDIEAGEELLYDYGDRSKSSLELHPWLKM